MVQVNLYEAKTQLSKLVDRAAAGEDIVIAKNGAPMAVLVAPEKVAKRKVRFGILKEYGWTHDTPFEVFEPEPEDAIDSPLIPGDPTS
jgi:prevent-host-death family protein